MQNNFSSAIEDRKAKKIKSELTFVGIKSSAIENFEKTAEALYFTVKFVRGLNLVPFPPAKIIPFILRLYD